MRRVALLRQHNTTSKASLCLGVKFGLEGKGNWIEAPRVRLLASLPSNLKGQNTKRKQEKSSPANENMMEQVKKHY